NLTGTPWSAAKQSVAWYFARREAYSVYTSRGNGVIKHCRAFLLYVNRADYIVTQVLKLSMKRQTTVQISQARRKQKIYFTTYTIYEDGSKNHLHRGTDHRYAGSEPSAL